MKKERKRGLEQELATKILVALDMFLLYRTFMSGRLLIPVLVYGFFYFNEICLRMKTWTNVNVN